MSAMVVEIADPTDWPGASGLSALVMAVAAVGYFSLKAAGNIVKACAAMSLTIIIVVGLVLEESARETAVIESNVAAVESAYDVTGLAQAGDDRPGGGEWLDPSAGAVTRMRVAWTDRAGDRKTGWLVMDGTGGKPTAGLAEDESHD